MNPYLTTPDITKLLRYQRLAISLFLVAIIAIPFSLSAAPQETSTKPADQSESELKEEDVGRDPFWPVGYTKKKPEPEIVEVVEKKAPPKPVPPPKWPAIKVKGLTRTQNGYIAIVEGQGLVLPGKIIRISRGKWTYQWKVQSIAKNGLKCKKLGVVLTKDLKKK